MTVALKSVFEKINRLPAEEQDALADLLSQEISWQKSYANSQKELNLLAMEALTEYKKGKTKPMNLK